MESNTNNKTEEINKNQEDIGTIEEKSWKDIDSKLTEELQSEWKDRGFNYEECKKWINAGLRAEDVDFICWLESRGWTPSKLYEISPSGLKFERETYKYYACKECGKSNIKNDYHFDNDLCKTCIYKLLKTHIDYSFTPDLQKEWGRNRFSYEQIKEWINIGLKPVDAGFATWLRDIEKIGIKWISNYGNIEDLKKEYERLLVEVENGSKLSPNTIRQIKSLTETLNGFTTSFNVRYPSNNVKIDSEEWEKRKEKHKKEYEEAKNEYYYSIKQLIPNERLRERFIEYGLCQECQQPNTGKKIWKNEKNEITFLCQPCNSISSGNQIVDEFIKKSQLEATYCVQALEWIPYKKFTNIEYLTEGGFGKIYKGWWASKHKWVVLKSLNNSQAIEKDFLQEIANHKLFDFDLIVKCYGISQNLDTSNYVMVMDYIDGHNLRQYLKKYHGKLDFMDKLHQLMTISKGLNVIHSKGLMHKDFHSGNILNLRSYGDCYCYITDLGLSRPVNETEKEDKVYGVLPYMAPELFMKKPYTPAADIYSFGIVAYEIMTGLPPYYNLAHNTNLVLSICNGKRPEFNIKIPQLLEDLINECWDADPLKRLTAEKLCERLSYWNYKDATVHNQNWKVEEYNKTLPDEIRFPKYKIHPQASYISKPWNIKKITELIQSQHKDSKQDCLSLGEVMKKFSIEDDKNKQQANIQIPPK